MLKRSRFAVLAAVAGVLLFVCGCKSQDPSWDPDNAGNVRTMPRAADDPVGVCPVDRV